MTSTDGPSVTPGVPGAPDVAQSIPDPEVAPATPDPEVAHSTPDPAAAFEAKVVRSFFRDGRLVSIPAQDKKKLVVLRHLRDRCFAEDRAYPEKEVNQRLAIFHPDVAALRRYLVDFGLMTREAGEYRRV